MQHCVCHTDDDARHDPLTLLPQPTTPHYTALHTPDSHRELPGDGARGRPWGDGHGGTLEPREAERPLHGVPRRGLPRPAPGVCARVCVCACVRVRASVRACVCACVCRCLCRSVSHTHPLFFISQEAMQGPDVSRYSEKGSVSSSWGGKIRALSQPSAAKDEVVCLSAPLRLPLTLSLSPRLANCACVTGAGCEADQDDRAEAATAVQDRAGAGRGCLCLSVCPSLFLLAWLPPSFLPFCLSVLSLSPSPRQ